MKSEQNFSDEISVTPSLIMEYLYCPRFIYFMECLKIAQHEQRRYKVQRGRNLHQQKERINKDYIRKKIGCIGKEISVYLSSVHYKVRGVVDEVLYFDDDTLSPLEYKFAEYKNTLFKTHKIQLVLQALLIKDNYHRLVNKGFIVFTRSKNFLLEVSFYDEDFQEALTIINTAVSIIQRGYYPDKTKYKRRCVDCCYKNICA